MGEVSNRLSSSWQMRSDVSPPPVSLSFPRMTKKDHTSEVRCLPKEPGLDSLNILAFSTVVDLLQ